MNKQIFLLFSHKLTEVQEEEIYNKLNCGKINYLPENLKYEWSNVDKEEDKSILFQEYLKINGNIGDYVLIQGEWGMTYTMITYCKANNLIPLYAYSKRSVVEKKDGENIKKISFFKHIKFMEY